MATNASLLIKVDAALESLLDAIATDSMEEYEWGGRKYRRAQFDGLLLSLTKMRDGLLKKSSYANAVRVGKIGRPRRVDR